MATLDKNKILDKFILGYCPEAISKEENQPLVLVTHALKSLNDMQKKYGEQRHAKYCPIHRATPGRSNQRGGV